MTRTVLESKTKTVVIGFDEPFCVIGERINPTGRKKLAAELEAGNYDTVIKDACWTSTRARSSPTRWRRTRATPTTTSSSRR